MSLKESKCEPCEGGVPSLSDTEVSKYLQEVTGWKKANNSIEKSFSFDSYVDGLDFVYSIGKIADREGHHPDIYLGYKKVTVSLKTHAINGLSKNDFILAAKIDQL